MAEDVNAAQTVVFNEAQRRHRMQYQRTNLGNSTTRAHLQFFWQLHQEPGVLLDVLQLDALIWVCHKDPGDEISAPIAELHIRWVAVLSPHNPLQHTRDGSGKGLYVHT